ncbi:MAG: hypothetical protein Q8O76_14320, partial [Chloroflexota bacterium]|nr:hypothetical protein [Chloroflexota bacterium]
MTSKKWPPCDRCGKPVAITQGVLVIKKDELDKYEADLQQWEQEHPQRPGELRPLTTKELLTMPETVDWHWGHTRCFPNAMY